MAFNKIMLDVARTLFDSVTVMRDEGDRLVPADGPEGDLLSIYMIDWEYEEQQKVYTNEELERLIAEWLEGESLFDAMIHLTAPGTMRLIRPVWVNYDEDWVERYEGDDFPLNDDVNVVYVTFDAENELVLEVRQ